MRASLSFTLPEEREEFDLARQGGSIMRILDETLEHIRRTLKYGSEELSEDKIAVYEEIRQHIISSAGDYGVEL